MFLQPCFIKKDTPELRDKLKEIGINPHPCIAPKCVDYLFVNRGFYSRNEIGYEEETRAAIDCGINEELFLALAALRIDTDKYQWFTDVSGHWYKNNYFDEGYKFIFHHPVLSDFNAHKATVKEIINHFK